MNAQIINYELLRTQVERHPYPALFATISGAHLYGFPSADSDFDLRGAHILPAREVIGLDIGDETIDRSYLETVSGVEYEMDFVTHDVKKFFGLMLKKNGYVLEQLMSPLIVSTTPEHDELKSLTPKCVTRHHSHHYLGFAANQWKLFRKEAAPRIKPLLYVYRVLLTGIHLMKSGEVEANLLQLNESFKLPFIDDLVQQKLDGAEKDPAKSIDLDFHEREYTRLLKLLEDESARSTLPEVATAKPELHDLLIRLRLPGQ